MWKDTTSYSRGSDRRNPTMFTLKAHSVTITLVRHIDPPGTWSLLLSRSLIDCILGLDTNDLEEAKQKAITITLKALTEQIESFSLAAEFLKAGIGS